MEQPDSHRFSSTWQWASARSSRGPDHAHTRELSALGSPTHNSQCTPETHLTGWPCCQDPSGRVGTSMTPPSCLTFELLLSCITLLFVLKTPRKLKIALNIRTVSVGHTVTPDVTVAPFSLCFCLEHIPLASGCGWCFLSAGHEFTHFCLYNIFIQPWFLKGIFAGYRILRWQFFCSLSVMAFIVLSFCSFCWKVSHQSAPLKEMSLFFDCF